MRKNNKMNEINKILSDNNNLICPIWMKIYKYIVENNECSKSNISMDLRINYITVLKYLKLLEQYNLVSINDEKKSVKITATKKELYNIILKLTEYINPNKEL